MVKLKELLNIIDYYNFIELYYNTKYITTTDVNNIVNNKKLKKLLEKEVIYIRHEEFTYKDLMPNYSKGRYIVHVEDYNRDNNILLKA